MRIKVPEVVRIQETLARETRALEKRDPYVISPTDPVLTDLGSNPGGGKPVTSCLTSGTAIEFLFEEYFGYSMMFAIEILKFGVILMFSSSPYIYF